MLRTSSYTIYVALPDDDDTMLLVQGYTGAYDKVSRRVAEYLMSLEAGTPPTPLYGEWSSEPALLRGGDTLLAAPTVSDRTIASLTRRGFLTSMSVTEEEGYVAGLFKTRHARTLDQGPSYIIMPTYDCNLRCAYCFQSHMRTKPEYSHLLRTMSRGMADRILAAMPTIESRHGQAAHEDYTRSIGFFGGEPLLASGRDTVEYIMTRAKAMGKTRFWAVSNATELDAYADLLGPDGISMIQITLDGPPDEHDRRRVYADGSGSFERIGRNIDLCLDRGTLVSIRMNLDRLNIGDVPRLADEIVRRGWDQRAGFSVYTAPITPSEGQSMDTLLSRWDLDVMIDEMRVQHPATRIIGRPDDGSQQTVRRMFDEHFAGVPQFRTGFCGAHSTMYIFDAFGDIYACWERTGDERVRIGRVMDDGAVDINEGLSKLWRTRTPATNPTCRKCRYAFQCGGGCAVLAEQQTGKFHSNHCDGFANRFRESVAMAYLDHVRGAPVREQTLVCDL